MTESISVPLEEGSRARLDHLLLSSTGVVPGFLPSITPEVLLGGGAGRKACLTTGGFLTGQELQSHLSESPGRTVAGVAVLIAGAQGGFHPWDLS